MKCEEIPEEILEKFKSGASEIEYCGPQWNGNAKFVERKGGKVCARYFKKDIPKKCLRNQDQ